MRTVPLFETSTTEYQNRTPTGGLYLMFLEAQQEGNWSAWANRHPDHHFLAHLGVKIRGVKYEWVKWKTGPFLLLTERAK